MQPVTAEPPIETISNVATNGYEPNEQGSYEPTGQETPPEEAEHVVEVEPLAPVPTNENTEYLFIFILFLAISSVYILSTGVEVGGIEKIFTTHPHYVNMLLATIYSLLAVVFLFAHKTDENSSFRTAVSLVIALVIIMFWVLNYRRYTTQSPTHKNRYKICIMYLLRT